MRYQKSIFILVTAVLILCMVLTGCVSPGSQPDREEDPNTDIENSEGGTEDTVDDVLATQKQLQLIAANKDLWRVLEEMDSWGYAVTDLNQNGRLEIISSECHGTGFYSTTRIFEVNEAGDALVKYADDFEEYDSQPDFLFAEEYQAFYIDGACHMIVEDMIKEGAAVYHYVTDEVSLKEGRIAYRALAQRTESYVLTGDDTERTTSFFDGENNSITEEEYNALINSAYEDLPRYRVKMGWSGPVSQDALSEEELFAMLRDSYGKFVMESV